MESKIRGDDALRVFISDCEGPISTNDNAFELTALYVPDGEDFFTKLSRYDDILADIVRKPRYKAGNTLKFIVPFLRVYGATDKEIFQYSLDNLLLLPSAQETLKYVKQIMPSYLVSTSYEHYIRSICRITGFPFENAYCTRLNVDKYIIYEEEAERIRKLRNEISAMPMIEVPHGASSIGELPTETRYAVERLNQIFWSEIPRMRCGEALKDVEPVGGYEKAKVVREIAKKLGAGIKDVMYVGDSITDLESFRYVREHEGLTISFNGNEYAVREAEIAVLSRNTQVTSLIAYVFKHFGKLGVIKMAEEWPESLKSYGEHPSFAKLSEETPRMEVIKEDNISDISRESSLFRREVRGEKVGALG